MCVYVTDFCSLQNDEDSCSVASEVGSDEGETAVEKEKPGQLTPPLDVNGDAVVLKGAVDSTGERKVLKTRTQMEDFLRGPSCFGVDDTTWRIWRAIFEDSAETMNTPATFKTNKAFLQHLLMVEICCICMSRSEISDWPDTECSVCKRWSHGHKCSNLPQDATIIDMEEFSGGVTKRIVENGHFRCALCVENDVDVRE